jgi:malate dehydrogenase
VREVAIIGAGQLGGAIAHEIARRQLVRSIRLVDPAGGIAKGKALDLSQAGAVEGSATAIAGATELAGAAGADLIVVADHADSSDWKVDEGLLLVRQLQDVAPRSLILAAGAPHRELVERSVRERGVAREKLFGSAPEAMAAAARAIVALELNVSPLDVSLTVFGIPGSHLVVGWEHATFGGGAVSRALDEPSRRRVTSRIAALWPPGPLALAAGAGNVIAAIAGRSHHVACCFVAPDDLTGRRLRAAALPVRLGPSGIVDVLDPSLSPAERTALDNAVLL